LQRGETKEGCRECRACPETVGSVRANCSGVASLGYL
jgi:hypothetical protein